MALQRRTRSSSGRRGVRSALLSTVAAITLTLSVVPAIADDGAMTLGGQTDRYGPPETLDLQPPAAGHVVIRSINLGAVTAGNSTDFVFNVPDHMTITDLDVALDLETIDPTQAIVELAHGGVSVTLLDQPACTTADVDIVLDDEAPLPADDACIVTPPPGLLGRVGPSGPLSIFDGTDVRGEWTLSVEAIGADVRVDNWALHVAGPPADPAIAILTSDGSSTRQADASDKLWATGRFERIRVHRTHQQMPSPTDLARYDGVIVNGNSSFDGDTLGDRLADYVDAGGGVVLMWPVQTTGSIEVAGRFKTDGYGTFTSTSFTSGDPVSGLDAVLPNHPILDGVTTIAASTHSVGPVLLAGAQLVANWGGTSLPLVATRTVQGGRVASLDFFSASTDTLTSGWDATTDGAALMANALEWVMEDITCNGLPATIVGTEGDDAIVGTPGADVIVALGGKDTIRGRNGNDTICAGTGSDWIDPGDGNDWVHGQAGNDTISYATAGSAVTVNLAADTASGGSGNDTLLSIEFANGSPFNDTLTGDGAANVLRGIGGADTIDGKGGDDTILAGAGSDLLIGGPGDDKLNGGGGADEITYAGSPAGVVVNLLAQTATGHGNDTPKSIERITGSQFADTLDGNGFRNIINGGAGNDIIRGRGSNDVLNGGAGTDTINGGAGTDTCTGETVIACE